MQKQDGFDILHRNHAGAKTTSTIEDKKLRIGLAELREGLEANQFELWWKAGKNQPADVLTKDTCPALLQDMRRGRFSPTVGRVKVV